MNDEFNIADNSAYGS